MDEATSLTPCAHGSGVHQALTLGVGPLSGVSIGRFSGVGALWDCVLRGLWWWERLCRQRCAAAGCVRAVLVWGDVSRGYTYPHLGLTPAAVGLGEAWRCRCVADVEELKASGRAHFDRFSAVCRVCVNIATLQSRFPRCATVPLCGVSCRACSDHGPRVNPALVVQGLTP